MKIFKWVIIMCAAFSANLHAGTSVLAFAGSTREDSLNKKLVMEAAQRAKDLGCHVTVIDLNDYPMPFYDADLEKKEGIPNAAKELRQLMKQSNIILIASPEYNASIPGILKNTIDWTSRNENGGPSREAYKGKTFILMSASPGGSGGARGLKHLRAIIEEIGGTVPPEQVVVPNATKVFNGQGRVTNPKVQSDLQAAIKAATH